jgi:hypothetical protein
VTRRFFLLSLSPPLSPTLRLTYLGLGPIRIGLTATQIRAALPHTLVPGPDEVSGPCYTLTIETENASPLAGLSLTFRDSRLVRLDIDTPDWQTQSGARVRMPESKFLPLYPRRLRPEPHPFDSTGRYYFLDARDPLYKGLAILFESDGERITKMRAGQAQFLYPTEACA